MSSLSGNRISVIGLGSMGYAMANFLVEKKYTVTVWNRTSEKAAALVRSGAVLAKTAADAIAASDITIMCVFDYKAADSILRNDEVASAIKGHLLIQLTTGSPQEASDTQEWVNANGGKYLDGALQIAPDQLGMADATVLVSGSGDSYREAETVLRILCGNTRYLGDNVRAASAMDIATLSCLYGLIVGFFQGALVSEKEGFSVAEYGSIINEVMPAFGAFLKHEGAVIDSADYSITQSPMKISVEATKRIRDFTRAAGLNDTLPTYFAELFNDAAKQGLEEQELAALIKLMRKQDVAVLN